MSGFESVCDPALGSTVLQRRKDFIQPPVVKQFVGIFGENVLQVSTKPIYRFNMQSLIRTV